MSEIVAETFSLEGWEEPETGLLIEENEEWVLVHHIPVDYVLDGYRIYQKRNICGRERSELENKIELVHRLRGTRPAKPEGLQLLSGKSILEWCMEKFGMICFQSEIEGLLTMGKITSINDEGFFIEDIDAEGNVLPDIGLEYRIEEIRLVAFGMDYFDAVSLLVDYQEKGGRA